MQTVTLELLPGNGLRYEVQVAYLTPDMPRSQEGLCAFCEGDPCGEGPAAPERIREYMAGGSWIGGTFYPPSGSLPPHCPFCQGRAH